MISHNIDEMRAQVFFGSNVTHRSLQPYTCLLLVGKSVLSSLKTLLNVPVVAPVLMKLGYRSIASFHNVLHAASNHKTSASFMSTD